LAAYTTALDYFLESRKAQYVADIERRHMLEFAAYLIYAALPRQGEAFLWLERAREERAPWMVYVKALPWFDNLRADPRFYCLLQRMNIPI
jgi:hypothetical protein